MGLIINVIDETGTSTHEMLFAALKCNYTIKIGTVVITDLRMEYLPPDLDIVETMPDEGIVLSVNTKNWTVSNATGKSYTGTSELFFLSLHEGKLRVLA